jgi:orotidine-5'-phosphate decarboxylase
MHNTSPIYLALDTSDHVYIVIGRPITEAADPAATCRQILSSLP